MKEKEKSSKENNRWFKATRASFQKLKGTGNGTGNGNGPSGSEDDKKPKQEEVKKAATQEDLPWGGIGPASASASAAVETPASPVTTIPAEDGQHIEVQLSPAPSPSMDMKIDVAKDLKGKEIVDEYLLNSQRNINISAAIITKQKNTKKLDQYGFIVNLDNTGLLRDEDSVDLPGGAFTPSTDTPLRNHKIRRHHRKLHKQNSKLSKRERRQIAKLNHRREKKWLDMLQQWETFLKPGSSKLQKLRQRIRKGIPNSIRGEAWGMIARVPQKVKETHEGVYATLVALSCENTDDLGVETFQPNLEGNLDDSVTKETIERDLTRTFPRHDMFYDQDDYDDSDGDDFTDGSFDKLSQSGSFDSFSQASTGEEEEVVIIVDPELDADADADADADVDAEIDADLGAYSSNSKDIATACAKDVAACANDCLARVPCFVDKKEEPFVPVKTPTKRKKIKLKPVIDFSSAEGGQAKLRRVLRAYSVFDPDVGYCQGMNFIAGMFITFVEEEDAFWILVNVMNESPCRMRGLFGEGMTEAHQVLHVADRLINQFHPRLARHFDREQIHISMFATQWLLTMYTSSFPFDVVTRVWDAFLSEGWKVAYRVMLALLERAQPLLMKMSFEEILNYFKEMPFEIDPNEIMELSFKIPLKKKHITKYAKEYERLQQKKESEKSKR